MKTRNFKRAGAKKKKSKRKRGLIEKVDGVVDIEFGDDAELTSWGGLGLAERLACRIRLWRECRRRLPSGPKIEGGYHTTTVVAAILYGLLSGAHGTFAAQSLREDEVLKKLLGLRDGVPEEATVGRALKQMHATDGAAALGEVLRIEARRLIEKTALGEMTHEGFVPVFIDGTWLEVGRETRFEGVKYFKDSAKLMGSSLWIGPYLAGWSFAAPGEDERRASMRLLAPAWREVIQGAGLADRALFVVDSLYGDEGCLSQLEACRGAHYVAGANKLAGVEAAAMEQPETQWVDTGMRPGRFKGWEASGLCVHRYQGMNWPTRRTVVTRRYRRGGEMFWRYRSVLTNLEPDDPRIERLMSRERIGFAAAVWRLYDRKQSMENQFKDLLRDLGLHHPPSARLGANEVFYLIGALALNPAVGLRRIGLRRGESSMALWRLRREVLAMPARAVRHARRVKAVLYSTSNRLKNTIGQAHERLASC